MEKIEIINTYEEPHTSIDAFEEDSGTLYMDEIPAHRLIIFKRRYELYAIKEINLIDCREYRLGGYSCTVKGNPPIEEVIASFFTNLKYVWEEEE